jgi:hypothetical protein
MLALICKSVVMMAVSKFGAGAAWEAVNYLFK